jgi:hypothetical protein
MSFTGSPFRLRLRGICYLFETVEFIPIYGTRYLRGKEAHAMAGGQCRGLPSRPPACLAIPSMTVDELQRLMPSFEAAIQAPMGLCAPSIVSGCTSHSGTRWFNRDKLKSTNARLVDVYVLIRSKSHRILAFSACHSQNYLTWFQNYLSPVPTVNGPIGNGKRNPRFFASRNMHHMEVLILVHDRCQEINGKVGAGVRDFLAAAFAVRCE